jgi:hypothetical protein
MKITFQNERLSDKGYIYVASKNRMFYEFALMSAQSLRDLYPKAHITLFTHKNFVDDRVKVFDTVITDIPIHYRAKMWCMARTPYEKTVYIDCDSQIMHKDVAKIFDFLDSCDLFCGSNALYTVANIKWAYIDIERKNIPVYHGSMWGYHKTKLNLDLMQTWFDEYVKQVTSPWPHSDWSYAEWQKFDMFTIWKITSKMYDEFSRFNELNIKILPRRWNVTSHDIFSDLDGPPVICQINKTQYRSLSNINELIEKSVKNEKHKVEQYSIEDPVIRYN